MELAHEQKSNLERYVNSLNNVYFVKATIEHSKACLYQKNNNGTKVMFNYDFGLCHLKHG
jgi:hypothetical protein